MEILTWDNWPHVIRTQQFSMETLEQIVAHTARIEKAMRTRKPLPRLSVPRPWLVKELFYEPSTRTEDTRTSAK